MLVRVPRERAVGLAVTALLVVFVAVTFGPALVGHGMLLDTGWQRLWMPYAAQHGVPRGALWCRGDTFDYYLPGVANIVDAARHGRWQTWAPYEVGGTPLASLPNHAVLSPISWPYWVMPLWLAPAWAKLTELVVVLVGMTLFLGRLGVRRWVGMVAGLIFFTSGFMMMWTNWPHTKVAAFIPLLLWALDRAVRERGARDAAAVGLVVAAMLFGGFPAVTLFALTLGAVYVVVRGLLLRDVSKILLAGAVAAGGVALGAALSAVQLLPFAHYMSTLGLGYREPNQVMPGSLALTSVVGDVYGTCVDGVWYGQDNAIEAVAFVGVVAVVLAVCALTVRLPRSSRPGVPVLLGCCLAAVVWLLWVGGLPLHLLQKLPGYDSNSFARASSIFGFLVAALAGIGLERLLQRAAPRSADDDGDDDAGDGAGRRPAVWAPIVFGVLALAATVWFAHEAYEYVSARPGGVPGIAARLKVPVVLGVAALLAVAATLLLRGRWRLVGPAVLTLGVVVQSTLFAHEVLPLTDRSEFYPVTPAHRFLAAHLGADRYGASGWERSPVTDFYRLRTPTGHEFTTSEWKSLLAAVSPDVQQSPTYSDFPANVPHPGQQPVLDQLSVRYWVTGPQEVLGRSDTLHIAADRRKRLVLPPDTAAACRISPGTVRGVEVTLPRGLTPRADRPTLVKVSVGSGADTVHGERAVNRTLPAGALRVAVPEHRFGRGPVPVTIRFAHGPGPVALAGLRDGSAVCRGVRPEPGDGLRVVHASAGAVVYRRATSLPRIRWAGTSEVVPDPAARVARLKAGVGPSTVLLDDGSTPRASGSTAHVQVTRDVPGSIAARVDAAGAGYLVVADAIARPGWVATVDGRRARLVAGNHAFGAVPVPAGAHTVELRYHAPGLRTGAVVSAVAGLVTVGLLLVGVVRRRPRTTT